MFMASCPFQRQHWYPYRYIIFSILALLLLVGATDARQDYDRVISKFNPEGRLEQVEYSAQAATTSMVAAIHDNRFLLLVAPSGSRLEPILVTPTNDEPTIATAHDACTGAICIGCWMIGTGIAGDVLWLRDNLRRLATQESEELDNTTVLVERLVQALAEVCHRQTFIPGARPLGAAALILSWSKNVPGLMEVSGWNGALAHPEFACLGPQQEAIRSLLRSRRQGVRGEPISAVANRLVDVTQQVLGKKEPLDLWILNENGVIRQYTNIRNGKSRRFLAECIREIDS